MKLIIANKLNFLMRLTETKNNMLGKAISFDPSYISRIRTGKRGLPKNREFIIPAAEFFARCIRTDRQKMLLSETICPDQTWPEDFDVATRLLVQWLGEGIDLPRAYNYPYSHESFKIEDSAKDSTPAFYFGNAGKRKCVFRFLTELAAQDEPVKLLLHSEEDMQWMFENPDFLRHWASLLKHLLDKGGHIVIVHTVRRSIGEMLEAVARWSPLYATGSIEAWYCPKLRDNIFHHTLFIARGKAAILARTACASGVNRLNILIHDPQAVDALERDFEDYLTLCRPLMKVINSANLSQMDLALARFATAGKRVVQFHATPSWQTMPDEVAISLSRHPGCASFRNFMNTYRKRLLGGPCSFHPITDIIFLPDPGIVKEGKVPVPLADLFGLSPLFYTVEEFRQHLIATRNSFQKNSDYHVVCFSPDVSLPLSGNLSPESFAVVACEGAGILLYSTQAPTTVFYTREQDMTLSFSSYLERIIESAASRKETMAKLDNYIKALE